MESLIGGILQFVLIYLILGFVFTVAFLSKGLAIVDDGTKETSWRFKFLILPGMLMFWPLFAYKWQRSLK